MHGNLNTTELKIDVEAIIGRGNEVGDEEESRRQEEYGNNSGFVREDLKYKKDRFKNYEIYKLKKQIEDNQALISKLTVDSAKYKKKQFEYEDAVTKIARIERDIEEIKAETKYEAENIKSEIYDREMLLNCKIIDFNDMSELLKRSEEKRHYSNEYNIFMESNSAKLKDKIGSLAHQKIRLEYEIEEINKKITEQEGIIRELEKRIEKATEKLEYERTKNSHLTYNYNSAKEELRDSNEKNEIIKNKYRDEKEKLKEVLQSQKTEKFSSKKSDHLLPRSTTLDEQSTINENSREEVQKWQQKYAGLEKELNQAREELEKMKKNSSYLTNQLNTKDVMISQIESLMMKSNKKEEEKYKTDKGDGKNSAFNSQSQGQKKAELESIVNDIIEKYQSSEETLKCNACNKMPMECYLAVPCGHLSCQNCKRHFEVLCPLCSGKITGLVHAISLDRIIYNFKKEVETMERAKNLLEHAGNK